MAEVGEKDIARFVAEFMVDSPMIEDGNEEELDAADAAKRKKKLEIMMKGVERASGGELAGLTTA
jgi:melanoma-associated antigen